MDDLDGQRTPAARAAAALRADPVASNVEIGAVSGADHWVVASVRTRLERARTIHCYGYNGGKSRRKHSGDCWCGGGETPPARTWDKPWALLRWEPPDLVGTWRFYATRQEALDAAPADAEFTVIDLSSVLRRQAERKFALNYAGEFVTLQELAMGVDHLAKPSTPGAVQSERKTSYHGIKEPRQ